jgi:ABC-2 type transport system permease protein
MSGEEAYGDRRAMRAIALATAKKASRQGAVWGYILGGTIAASAYSFHSLFGTPVAKASLAMLQSNVAWAALFGPLVRLNTVAGYAAYKSGMTVMVLGSIWGLLISTKVTRGEEDAGRWEILLSGQTTREGALRQAMAGLAAGWLTLWAVTAAIVTIVGALPSVGVGVGTSFFAATALLAPTLIFMAVGVFAGQLSATRHDADLIGAAVLAASYLLRMAADSDRSLTWLRWASPLGWIEQLRPLTGSAPMAFVPIVLLVAALVTGSVLIARGRDLGASALPDRDTAKPRTVLLGGQAGLTLRLTVPALTAWTAALVCTGLVFGLVAQAAGKALSGAPSIERMMRRLGAQGVGASTYLGLVFVIAAGLVSIAVAGQIAAIRNEEASGHLDNLLVRPVARWRWLAVRLMLGLGLVLLAGLSAGFAAWVGAASQHSDIALGKLLEAGVNVVPPALFVLGVGALAFGIWPRGAIGIAYGVVVWSFLADIFASLFGSNHWLMDTSPLHHIAPAPAASPDWSSAAWLVGLGVVAAAVGTLGFVRRDVAGA